MMARIHKLFWVCAVCCVHGTALQAGERALEPGTMGGAPRVDLLMDGFILSDGAGGYWLTGTAGTLDGAGRADFDFNRGAPLFHSGDLQEWKPVGSGYNWDRVEHLVRTDSKPKLGIWMDWSAPGERLDGLLAQATTAPKLYLFKGSWFLLCSMNRQNLLLQKSIGKGPEGPFEDYAFIASRAPDASFFLDEDGQVYLIYAEGWIARMESDLKGLAEDPRPLMVETEAPGSGPLMLGQRGGVSLFKRDGQYHLLAPMHQIRDGRASHDALLWVSDSVYGPYRRTDIFLEGSGPVSVFQKSDSAWVAVSALPADTSGPRLIPVPEVAAK